MGGRLRVADQGGGPVLEGAGDCRDAAGQAGGQDEAGRSNARSTRSITEIGQVAAIANDEIAHLRPQRMARRDAEVAANVGDDGADRATADLGGDLLGRGQADLGRAGGVGGSRGRRSAVGGRTWRRGLGVQSGGVTDDPGFERLGTEEAAGDAREEQCDVTGAERGGLIRSVVASCLP